MAYITPGTIVDLMSVAMDPTYKHVRYFATNADKNDYFDGKIVRTLTAQTYQNYTDGTIRLSVTPSQVLNCNYMRFRNVGYENKNYYAFIISTTDISNECVEINFKIDSFMTYWMDYSTPYCFIERMHTRTDDIGDNVIPEPISAEKIDKHTGINIYENNDGSYTSLNNCYYDLTNISLMTTPNQWDTATMRTINHQYAVVNYSVYSTTSQSSIDLFLAVIRNLGVAGQMDSVISCKQFPSWAYDPSVLFSYTPTRDIECRTDSIAKIGTYSVRNYKLFTSQFTSLRIIASSGETLEMKPEFCNSQNISGAQVTYKFREYCVLGAEPNVVVIPREYSINNRENRLHIGEFPDVVLTKDSWNEYLNRNGSKIGLSMISSSINAMSPKANPADIVAPGAQLLGDMIDMKNQPASMLGSPDPSANLALGEIGWLPMLCQVRAVDAQKIDEFFDMYGYAINNIALPTRKIRDKYTYIKTQGLQVNGNIPVEAVTEISNAYNNGVTFWADNANFMNYALAIRQANSLH